MLLQPILVVISIDGILNSFRIVIFSQYNYRNANFYDFTVCQ